MSMLDSLLGTASAGRNTMGITPVYRPLVGGEPLDITVSKMELSAGEFQHDHATVSASSDTLTETDQLTGQAISFFYGLSPNTEIFHGYIEGVEKDNSGNSAGRLTFTLQCLGVTKELQVGAPRVWSKSTIPQVAELLSYRAALGYHGHPHPLLWKTLAQTEESDWKMLCDLAKRLGWSVFNRYGVVMLYDPLLLFRDNGSFIDLISAQYSSTAIQDYERALIEFTPIEMSDASYHQIGRKIAFFNDKAVQTVTQQGEKYTLFKYLSNFTVRNSDEAEVYANSTSHMAANWSQQATARVLGNATIFPGMCVDILTSLPKYQREHFNGRWLVRGVKHSADRQTFQTQLTLCRPDSSAGVSTTPYVQFWNQPTGSDPIHNPTQSVTTYSRSRPNLVLETLAHVAKGPTTGVTRPTHQWVSSWTDRRIRSLL